MNTSYIQLMIFSVERKELSPLENDSRTQFAERQLRGAGIPFEPVNGSYNGSVERGFLVRTFEETDEANYIERLARHYGQEAVMYVDSAYHAYLKDLYDGHYRVLGKWREIQASDVFAYEGYIRIGERYYVASHR